nr:S8 family serine peptidase [uncultured Massilia sp.]
MSDDTLDYIVLRSSGSATREVWGGSMGTMDIADAPQLTGELLALARHQLPALARDSNIKALAPSMPMPLIEPFDAGPGGPAAALDMMAWGVRAVRADTSPYSGEGVVVAVLDTGIDAAHPAFAGMELVQRDFTGTGNGDVHGHGTHCAGTIFGRDVDGVRVGVARGVRKGLIGKIIGGEDNSSARTAEAILWAVDQGAHVISLSVGISFNDMFRRLVEEQGFSPMLANARSLESYRANTRLFDRLAGLIDAQAAFGRAGLLIAAAGNDSEREFGPQYEVGATPPAIADGVVAVGALEVGPAGLKVANFSNTDATVSAPGVDVWSASPGGGWVSRSGTSMATPHVAGVAALWAEYLLRRGAFAPSRLAGKLASTATTAALAEGYDEFDVGAGLVQAPQEV